MHPLVRGAAAAAVLTALGNLDTRPFEAPAPVVVPPGQAKGVDGLPAPCRPGTLPEGPVCVRIPGEVEAALEALRAEAQEGQADGGAPLRGAEAEAQRSIVSGDRIPRRPERPADPALYVFPVGTAERPPRILGGFEAPGDSLLAGPSRAADPGGVHLAARPGEKVSLVDLDHQEGWAKVVFLGELLGPTVITEHTVQEGGRSRSYLLIHGRLDRAEPGLVEGGLLESGAVLGFARAELGGGLMEVYVEARQVRDGVTIDGLDGKHLLDTATAVPTDLRNVLALRH